MRNTIIVLLFSCVLSMVVFSPVDGYTFNLLSRYKEVKGLQGEVRIGIGEVNDGKAHYYAYKGIEKTVKFFIVKSPDEVIRAAFDACDVCFPAKKGYSQDGDFMVCNNCGRKFHANRVNVVEGGCNPAPLKRKQDGDQVVIKVEDILPGSRYF